MMTNQMMDQFTRTFEVELLPPTKWDAAQAVLYRVRDPFVAMDVAHDLTPAGCEAITDRVLPRQGLRRRRWISAAPLENPIDLHRPPHERPALVTAAGLAAKLPGGLLVEALDAFGGDLVHRAVVVTWLAEHAGIPGMAGEDDLIPDVALNPVGTFTVGDLGQRPRGRRFAMTARSDRTVHDHVHRLTRDAKAALLGREQLMQYEELYAAFDEATAGVWRTLDYNIRFTTHAPSSQLFADLSVEVATEHAIRMKAAGVHPNRAGEALQLAGFLNPAGNRLWNREHVEDVGGW